MAGEPKNVTRFQPRGFLLRALLYAAGLYIGCVVCVSIVTVLQKYSVSRPRISWAYVVEWFRFWVWPVALAELLRSPLTGLFFALVGPLRYSFRRMVSFGVTGGFLAYGFGYFFSVLTGRGPWFRQIVSDWNLVEGAVLGVPLLLILVARLRERR